MSTDPGDTPSSPWPRRALRAGFGAFLGVCAGLVFAARYDTAMPPTLLGFAGLGALMGLFGWVALRILLDALH